MQLHHDVRTETWLVPDFASAHEPRALVEGTRRGPSAAPQQAATVQLDVFEYRIQYRCAHAGASLTVQGGCVEPDFLKYAVIPSA